MKHSLVLWFILSLFIFAPLASAEPVVMDDRIEVNLYVNSGNRVREYSALFIQDALKPLGIDVTIHSIPFNHLVDKLLHLNEGPNFDMALIGFEGGGEHSEFQWKYHSTRTSFGQLLFQLNNPGWQEWQTKDTGITTKAVDSILENIDWNLDINQRIDEVHNFDKLFFDKLLYDYPLVTPYRKIALWNGFRNSTNEYNPVYSLETSRKLGYKWDNGMVSQERQAGENTLQMRTFTPGNPNNFDPFQSFDSSTTKQSELLHEPLVNIDPYGLPHPGLAYQWLVDSGPYDTDSDTSTEDQKQEYGRHTFILNTNFTFPETTDFEGNTIAKHNLDGYDVGLTIDYLQTQSTQMNGKELFDDIINWEVSTTITTDDTITVTLREDSINIDYLNMFGELIAYPYHILGGELTHEDPISGEQNTIKVSDDPSLNPQDTLQWDHYESLEGNTAVGPMTLKEYNIDEGYWTFTARDDYPYPNKWDIKEMYETNPTKFDGLASNLEPSNWDSSKVSEWTPHIPSHLEKNPYWVFSDDPTTEKFEKPSNQGITEVVYKMIEDSNAALIAFENADLDKFQSSSLGAETIQAHEENPDFSVFDSIIYGGPTTVVFDLLHEDLKKYNVRKAIGMAIDNEALSKIPGVQLKEANSIIWDSHRLYDNDGVNGLDYDIDAAMDLMEEEGYNTYPELIPASLDIQSFEVSGDFVYDDVLTKDDIEANNQMMEEKVQQNTSPGIISKYTVPFYAIVLITPIFTTQYRVRKIYRD